MEAERSTYLPNDILLDILLRLPVKTLLRFRSLSKHYKSLVSEPSFIRMHLQRQHDSNSNYNNLFLQISTNPKHKTRKQDRISLLKLDDVSRPFEITECPRPEYHAVLATCDGVMLLSDYSHNALMLWNPFTRKETMFSFPYRFSETWNKHGLFHDPATGDFKVVLASFSFYAVFSCKENAWTAKKKLPHETQDLGYKAGVFVDGAIYWVTQDWLGYFHPNNIRNILFCDLRDNEFKVLEKPYFCKGEYFNIVELRGCLCLYEHTRSSDKTAVQIWIKEKGVDRNGWDELMMIENLEEEPSEWFRVVCLLDNNKVLLQLREWGGFVVYNICEKSFAGFGELYDPLFKVQLVPCRESMLFPSQDNLKRSKRKRSQPLKLKI